MARKPAWKPPRKAGSKLASESDKPQEDKSDTGLRSLPQLIVLTGVPQGRIMQAVREGFVAATVRGQYQLGPALLGIIKFQNTRQDKLPTYDNAPQCSAATGIPESVIREARRVKPLGSDNRISLEILLRVMMDRNG